MAFPILSSSFSRLSDGFSKQSAKFSVKSIVDLIGLKILLGNDHNHSLIPLFTFYQNSGIIAYVIKYNIEIELREY